MLIDPFTVIAQIVNFAILAFVLKHFLYDRVIDAMDRREASIAAAALRGGAARGDRPRSKRRNFARSASSSIVAARNSSTRPAAPPLGTARS